jgi:hypothetical protein
MTLLRYQYIDEIGRLVRVYETPATAAARGFGEAHVLPRDGRYVETFDPEEARDLLGDELDQIERRLNAL